MESCVKLSSIFNLSGQIKIYISLTYTSVYFTAAKHQTVKKKWFANRWNKCSASTMPVQAAQWTEFLSCPICYNEFDENVHKPISLGCSHTVCKTCLNKLHRKACPFDQTAINTDIDVLPVNFALLQLVGAQVESKKWSYLLCLAAQMSWQNATRVYIHPLQLGRDMSRLFSAVSPGLQTSACSTGTKPTPLVFISE